MGIYLALFHKTFFAYSLGHEWKLHKVYLCQSGYFRGMLKGQWLESGQPFIAIEIPDEAVDRKGMHIIYIKYSNELTN